MLVKYLVAGFLLAHAAVHLGFVSSPPATAGGPQWPFELGRSWALTPLGLDGAASRPLAIALLAVVFAGYAVAALASAGLLPSGLFVGGVVAGSVASVAMLVLFFHPWLLIGVALDVVLVWAVLIARWLPEGLGS